MMTVTWQVGLLSKKTLLAGESTKDQAEPCSESNNDKK